MLDPSLDADASAFGRPAAVRRAARGVNAWITLPHGPSLVKLLFDRRVVMRNYSRLRCDLACRACSSRAPGTDLAHDRRRHIHGPARAGRAPGPADARGPGPAPGTGTGTGPASPRPCR